MATDDKNKKGERNAPLGDKGGHFASKDNQKGKVKDKGKDKPDQAKCEDANCYAKAKQGRSEVKKDEGKNSAEDTLKGLFAATDKLIESVFDLPIYSQKQMDEALDERSNQVAAAAFLTHREFMRKARGKWIALGCALGGVLGSSALALVLILVKAFA